MSQGILRQALIGAASQWILQYVDQLSEGVTDYWCDNSYGEDEDGEWLVQWVVIHYQVHANVERNQVRTYRFAGGLDDFIDELDVMIK